MKKGKKLPEDSSLRQKAEATIEKLNSGKENLQGANIGLNSTEAEMQKLLHELEVYQIELEMQNEELLQAKAKAEFAAEQYAELYEEIYDFSPAGYFTITPEGTICELNYNGAGMLGKARSDLVGSNFRLFISQATLPGFNDFLNKVFSTNSKQICELALSVSGEQDTFVHVEGMVSHDKGKCILSLININALKKSEESLRVSEQGVRLKLETILSPSGDPEVLELADIIDAQAIQAIMDEFYSITHIGVGLIDLNGKVLVANGWQDICTKFHRVHPEACRNCIESDTKLTLGRQLGSFNAYNCKNNMWDISTPIIVGGKHLGNIFLGQFLYDDEVPDYEAFRAQALKFGFDEAAYMDALDRVPRWSHETVKSVMSFYSRLSTLISSISFSNLKLAQTIEERNRAVEELKNSYSLLRIAGETAKFGGWSLDLIEKKVTWSDVVDSIHEIAPGYSPTVEEGINFYAPEYRDRITRAVSDCVEEGISYDMELELITAKGNQVWVRTTGEAVRAENGKIIKIQGSFQDITERKQIEERLRLKQEKYQTLFENMTQGVFYQSADGTFTDVNEAALKMFGLSRDQMLGRTSYDPDWKVITEKGELLTPEEHPSMAALISGKPCRDSIVGVFNPTNKQYRWLIVNAIPQFSPGETLPKQVFVTIHDITERKQIEAELVESEARFRNLLQAVPSVSVQGYAPDGTTQYWNKASELLYGYTAEEAIGRNLLDLIIPPEMKADVKLAIQQMAETGQAIPSSELSLMCRNGSYVSVFSSHVIVKIPGRPQELFCIDVDLTDRKRAEEELVELNSRLKELNATKDKFFSIIAHDLKSPFNSILGFSNLLERQIHEKDYAAIEKYAGIIHNSSQQAMDLLMNLLEWSRLQTGRMVFNPESIDIVALINQSTELLNASAQQKSITIYSEMPVNLSVFADKAMISTILRNLISNAIKFTETGGEIIISTEQVPNELVVSVSDNGVGIMKESIGKLFRIDENNSTLGTQNEKGTGLGLLLCKEFIDKHGGRIWVESEPGKGSRFFFSIPKV